MTTLHLPVSGLKLLGLVTSRHVFQSMHLCWLQVPKLVPVGVSMAAWQEQEIVTVGIRQSAAAIAAKTCWPCQRGFRARTWPVLYLRYRFIEGEGRDVHIHHCKSLPPSSIMPPKKEAPMSSGEKAAAKKEKAKENKAKANPVLAAENKASADAKRARRKESGSTKEFK